MPPGIFGVMSQSSISLSEVVERADASAMQTRFMEPNKSMAIGVSKPVCRAAEGRTSAGDFDARSVTAQISRSGLTGSPIRASSRSLSRRDEVVEVLEPGCFRSRSNSLNTSEGQRPHHDGQDDANAADEVQLVGVEHRAHRDHLGHRERRWPVNCTLLHLLSEVPSPMPARGVRQGHRRGACHALERPWRSRRARGEAARRVQRKPAALDRSPRPIALDQSPAPPLPGPHNRSTGSGSGRTGSPDAC